MSSAFAWVGERGERNAHPPGTERGGAGDKKRTAATGGRHGGTKSREEKRAPHGTPSLGMEHSSATERKNMPHGRLAASPAAEATNARSSKKRKNTGHCHQPGSPLALRVAITEASAGLALAPNPNGGDRLEVRATPPAPDPASPSSPSPPSSPSWPPSGAPSSPPSSVLEFSTSCRSYQEREQNLLCRRGAGHACEHGKKKNEKKRSARRRA